MQKNSEKKPIKISKPKNNGKPGNGVKATPRGKPHRKPLEQMTLEELTLFGFQLAYEQHQQQDNGLAHDKIHA